MDQRVVFTFDEASLRTLRRITARGDSASMGGALGESIQVMKLLQDQVRQGFSELVVRNRSANQEKTISVPSLKRAARNPSIEP